jgi:GTP-binding protein LepA
MDVGIFSPDRRSVPKLSAGEIGYIVTGLKSAGIASLGDTIGRQGDLSEALPGYDRPMPMVWASVFPEDQNDLVNLRQALTRLELSDSSLSFEEESSGILGKGFRCGFLGLLHLEIVIERLKREFDLELVITQPSINYFITYNKNAPKDKKNEIIYSASLFPDDGVIEKVEEPWVKVFVLTPADYISNLMQVIYEHEAIIVNTETFGDGRTSAELHMPLRELMRGFFDKLKSVSSGYASISYENLETKDASVTRLDILINGEVNPSFSRVVSRRSAEEEAEKMVSRLHSVIPRQMFELKIQAKALGRIIASETISAFRKDVTQHMYGGDITRKMKLREKQKKGKKKMREKGKLSIPHDVFIKAMRP